MVVNQKVTGKASSMPGGLAIGWGCSMAVTLLGSVIVAALLDRRIMEMDSIGYGTMLILLLSSMLGATLAVKRIKKQRMMVSMLAGAAYYLTLLAVTALFFGGQYEGMAVTGLVILGGSLAAALSGLRQKRGAARKRRS